ncbi:LacI family DNA-binding transcriptional regulator [Falsibacillus albus]|uniref:LacI family transcriptional regulator n=1 Tax=Falsibacillus albus TaxID=2478915 RepID=A0A3L7K1Z1_9BACI|nr:LacI family DNA-binding transcriptional regulator [Falsibacillus albus]RLQ96625.1 LacI family transcriptional regulator [Falsibacillus albus]
MATLKDVAKHAGVSVSTASYSINGNPLVAVDTRKKVMDAAKEIGYRPNGPAKNLKEQKTKIIGLFLSGFTGPFFNDMMEGIQDVVMEKGYELVVSSSVDRHRMLVERYVDGAIVLNYHMEDELLYSLASEKLPIVVLDRELNHSNIQNVLLPNNEGARKAAEYLIESGHKRLGFIAGSEESYDGEQRLSGFREELLKGKIPFQIEDLLRADFTEESGYQAMKIRMEKDKSGIPTAFLCANDEMAMGAIRAIQEYGLNVPEDISIIGFDDINVAQYFTPSLTTMRIPRKEWGINAAHTLFDMIERKPDNELASIKVDFMKRNSG